MVTSEAERTQHDLEHLWKGRVENAKRRLDTATIHVNETGNGSSSVLPADHEPHQKAIGEYTDVLAEYVMVSRIYQDLVLHGTVPDEDDAGHK
jgi:hypothetical protein